MEKLILIFLIGLVTLPAAVVSYCTIGNPYWVVGGKPTVEQVTLTSVRISWPGLLGNIQCADNMIIKYFKADNTNDYQMSEIFSVNTNSFIVRDLVPNQPYTFQVIAREDKGVWGVDYNKSEKTKFTTRRSNKQVEKDDPLVIPKNDIKEDKNTEEIEPKEIIKPVYGDEKPISTKTQILNDPSHPESLILGLKLEVFMGIIIGSLIIIIVAIGILYNCLRNKKSEKDIELEFESGSEDESSDEEEDEEFIEEKAVVNKYDMMLATTNKIESASAPKFEHSMSSPA